MTEIRRSFNQWRRWWKSDTPRTQHDATRSVCNVAIAQYNERLRHRNCIIPPPKKQQVEERKQLDGRLRNAAEMQRG